MDEHDLAKLFRPWTNPTEADRATAAACNGDDGPLFRYLTSGTEVPLNVGVYLVERLRGRHRGAPRKSLSDRYRTIACKQISVAAVLANEIARRWMAESGQLSTEQGPRLRKRAATEAIKLLKKRYPGKYRLKVDDVAAKMLRLSKVPFRPIFELLPNPPTK